MYKALSLSILLFAAPALAGEIGQVSKDEFYNAAYYKQALEHPAIQKLKSDGAKIAAVAKDLGTTPKKLKAAIDKVGALGGDPGELAGSAIKTSLEHGKLAGRVLDVLVNTDEPKHVVVYVRWQGSSQRDAVKEASMIAHAVSQVPLVSTLSLAAIHPKAPQSSKDAVWSGKIGRTSMERIDEARIDDYADRLYARLFEGVETKPF